MSMGRGGMGEVGMWPASDDAWSESIQKLEKISVRDPESLTVGSRKNGQHIGKAKSRGPGTWSPDGMWSPPPERDLEQSRPSTAGSSRSGMFSPGRRKSDPLETHTIHEVSNLDTLAGIAIKYGVQVEDVKRLNGLITDAAMFARKTLRIPPPRFETPSESPSHSASTSRRPSSTGESPFPPRPHPKKSMTPAMSSLRGYYGIASPEKRRGGKLKRNSDGEGMEMYTYHSNTASEDEQSATTSPVSRRALSDGGRRSSRWGMDDDDHLWDDWANKTSTRRAGTSASNTILPTGSTVSSSAGADLLSSIYGIGEEEIEDGGSKTADANGAGRWGTSEIEEIDLSDDTAQGAKETVLDGSGPRKRSANGANVLADSSLGSSSNGRGALPSRGPMPRNRSSAGGSSGRAATPPLAGGRSASKSQAPLRPVAGGPNVTEVVAGLSKGKIVIPDSLMSKVRRSSSASSLGEEDSAGRLANNKGPSFGSVGDLLTGAVVKRKAAKD